MTSARAIRPPASVAPPLGDLLRDWRAARRLSQLDLALDADISARHLSCVETGKAQPSRALVEALADALEIPLRERNALLVAAGYAPRYRETDLQAPEMVAVRQAIDLILRQQEPFPALVVSRRWELLMTNRALERVFVALRGRAPRHHNIMRQIFDPQDMRPVLDNWRDVAGQMIRHLHEDLARTPADPALRALLAEVLAYPDVPSDWRRRAATDEAAPLMTTAFRTGATRLRFFSTLTTFATPRDVTLDEVRIECMFPVDAVTERFCRELASADADRAGDDVD